MKNVLPCLVILLYCSPVFSQSVFCPPNIDFEQGNLANWSFYTGTCCPTAINPTAVAAIPNRHTITSGTGTDQYGGFPVVAPFSGNYSLKLGNNMVGSEAERARYYVQIPPGLNNFSILYMYAVVFEDPQHAVIDQPRFTVAVYDSATNQPIPCGFYDYVASSNIPGFQLAPGTTDVYFKPWTTSSIDLSGLGGQTIILDFTTSDCGLGGHFGYGYLDVTCGLFQIEGNLCNGAPNVTLSAPPGYLSYTWYDATLTNTLGTGQIITIPSPGVSTTYNVVLAPYPGYGCPDTLTTLITVSNISMNVSNDTTICNHDAISLFANAFGTGTTFNYSWLPATGLSCSNCLNPVFTATTGVPVSYTVTVVDQTGCETSDTVNINVTYHDTLLSKTVCFGDSYLGHSTTGLHIDTFTAWNGCDSLRHLNLNVLPLAGDSVTVYKCYNKSYNGISAPGIYFDTIGVSHTGCDSMLMTKLFDYPYIPVNLVDSSFCDGGKIMLDASHPDYISYQWNVGGSTPTLETNKTGDYIVTCEDIYGCFYEDTAKIQVWPLPKVEIAGNEWTPCDDYTILLTGTGASTYRWYRDSLVGNPIATGNELLIYPNDDYRLFLEGFNIHGCRDGDTAKYESYLCCEKPILPNAFSPNDDGLNDYFELIRNIRYKSFLFQIYDRWGNKVYHTEQAEHGWDGTFRGGDCQMGTYFYQVSVECENTGIKYYLKGDLTLVR